MCGVWSGLDKGEVEKRRPCPSPTSPVAGAAADALMALPEEPPAKHRGVLTADTGSDTLVKEAAEFDVATSLNKFSNISDLVSALVYLLNKAATRGLLRNCYRLAIGSSCPNSCRDCRDWTPAC